MTRERRVGGRAGKPLPTRVEPASGPLPALLSCPVEPAQLSPVSSWASVSRPSFTRRFAERRHRCRCAALFGRGCGSVFLLGLATPQTVSEGGVADHRRVSGRKVPTTSRSHHIVRIARVGMGARNEKGGQAVVPQHRCLSELKITVGVPFWAPRCAAGACRARNADVRVRPLLGDTSSLAFHLR